MSKLFEKVSTPVKSPRFFPAISLKPQVLKKNDMVLLKKVKDG